MKVLKAALTTLMVLASQHNCGLCMAFETRTSSFHRQHHRNFVRPPTTTLSHYHHDEVVTILYAATNGISSDNDDAVLSKRQKIRRKVTSFLKLKTEPNGVVQDTPLSVTQVLKEDAGGTVSSSSMKEKKLERTDVASSNSDMAKALDADILVEKAFAKADKALEQAEVALELAHEALREAKLQARSAIDSAEDAAVGEAQRAIAVAEEANQLVETFVVEADKIDVSTMTFDDAGFHLCEDMGEPFLGTDMCLVPGEAIARVEKAPENSRRIFAGIDIMASVDDVWNVLTDYAHLQDVVPNLVVNDVLELYNVEESIPDAIELDTSLKEEDQCQKLCNEMKGAKLRQVGGAKVAGINFSARTTLEVREWPGGMPDFAHFTDDVYEGKKRDERAKENAKMKLQRYRFPRPFALSTLPTKDISMQSIENDDGEFRMYQGVWRMQPLPGCAPDGEAAMRLTYAVEVSPRAYLPVALIERRIVSDLCNNLEAIRDHMDKQKQQEQKAQQVGIASS
mmetsp:Transcript_7254/g.10258  ORF Transcript_7254/g.10258 Transcript_7254/m.10258 type:complete len:511 (+) Transcript_7254:129-1661(+)